MTTGKYSLNSRNWKAWYGRRKTNMAKKDETENKYEKFTIERIKRNEIHGADYNPRRISESAKKKLK